MEIDRQTKIRLAGKQSGKGKFVLIRAWMDGTEWKGEKEESLIKNERKKKEKIKGK